MNTPNEQDPESQTPRPTRPPTPEDPTVEVPSSPGSQFAVPRSDTAAPPRNDPKSIGPYRVIRRLGHGGMGVVYLAQREDGPIRRPVAVKVMRAGLEATEVAQRFERERQVLAALDHPNIARLLDAGSTADGQPYFVMEFVEGQSLDQYCDERRLTVSERLKIFRQVCAAVHHAHQNLVVHRDIKPRNILVTTDGTPKLLDFGIAKLLNVSMAPAMDLHTETGVRLMTPEYASPEQVRGQSVTTAADVYSLGVVLFELLTGHRPFRLKTRLMQEVERVICEENPERPSTMITRVERLG
ncbi:MAG: serine/threonine protein kinase, partial [Phycisphaerales bacterium]|nr:serine/threonine protein kinase [Phycisphaerales bacterium]